MATGISDNTIMNYVIHDALRRDLEQLTRAVESRAAFDPARQHAFIAGWELFKTQLHYHHTGETARCGRGCVPTWLIAPMTSHCSM